MYFAPVTPEVALAALLDDSSIGDAEKALAEAKQAARISLLVFSAPSKRISSKKKCKTATRCQKKVRSR
jgi:hypothetical protein